MATLFGIGDFIGWYGGCLMVGKAMRGLWAQRHVPDVPFLLPVAVDLRPKGELGPTFGNVLAFHFARFKPSDAADVPRLAAMLRGQMADAMRTGQIEANDVAMLRETVEAFAPDDDRLEHEGIDGLELDQAVVMANTADGEVFFAAAWRPGATQMTVDEPLRTVLAGDREDDDDDE